MKQAHSRLIFKWRAGAEGRKEWQEGGKRPRIYSKVPFLKIISM